MSLTIKNDAFFLRQRVGEQWYADEVIAYALALCQLANMPVHIRFGVYDNGEAIGHAEPRWFSVYNRWGPEPVDDHIAAFHAGKNRLHGVDGVGEDFEDDDPIPLGYISAAGATMLEQNGKAIIHGKRDDLNCRPLYTKYKR